MPKANGHGGKREGAGRRSEGRVHKAFRLRPHHVELLERLHVEGASRGISSQADVVGAGLEALEREWRGRKGSATEERAAVARWLRSQLDQNVGRWDHEDNLRHDLAQAIERGEHLG